MRPGPRNAITDVCGIRVGHCTRDEPGWLTGCTVVVAPPGTVGGVDVRGGGPGTRETELLAPHAMVDEVDAVVLSGGSAFGLATADGVMRGAYAAGRGWPVGPGDQRVPIVPAAILFDLGRAGHWLHHPSAEDGRTAWVAAAADMAQGCVGVGTGAQAGGLRGGIGSASAVLDSGHTVAALVVVNAIGSPLSPDGSLLGLTRGLPGEFDSVPAPDPSAAQAYWRGVEERWEALRAGTATTLAVVATDAALSKALCRSMATVAHDGMARAISPVHTPYDGDTVFALATGDRPLTGPLDTVALPSATADCVARAIAHAMLEGTSVDRSGEGGVRLQCWADALTTQQP